MWFRTFSSYLSNTLNTSVELSEESSDFPFETFPPYVRQLELPQLFGEDAVGSLIAALHAHLAAEGYIVSPHCSNNHVVLEVFLS